MDTFHSLARSSSGSASVCRLCTRAAALHLALITSCLALTARPARAALGEGAASVDEDAKVLAASRGGTSEHGLYRVETVTSGSGTMREYVSASGVVFAVAWNGVAHPDLRPMLGSYAGEYESALARTPRAPGRRHQQVTTGRLVVEKWGHMRDLHGRAYAPALVPAGVSLDEIE